MKAMGIIFSNIYDSTLGELTNHRTVASLPFGGRYRQIDFILSNLSNSGIYNVGLITKYNYRSLMDHLGSAADWDMRRKNEGLVILPPFASGHTGVYKGKLEALYSAVSFIDNPIYDYVVFADTTVLCNIDFRPAIEGHIKSGADITVVSSRENNDVNKKHPLILYADKKQRVQSMLLDSLADENAYIGMGMFIIKRKLLVDAINESHAKGYVHFEKDYMQRYFNEGKLKVSVYDFKGVVLRNENIKSYYANNMALLNEKTRNGLFGKNPIYTKVRDEMPSFYAEGSNVANSLVADGCELYGDVLDSILFRDVTVNSGAVVKDSIIMQGTKIGKNAKLECVILDKNVTVTDNAELKGTREHPVIIKKGETV
ncbi:MAG: glucose-1-phosphate adenylyltransferase subunit GlgD [Clostridia bacterium]|nr:glucose-1-phosphate adenylyltransferase subunit GlgD [Clostridia bacterium]